MARMTLSDLTTAVSPWSRDKSSTEVETLANLIIKTLNAYDLGFNILRTTFTTSPTSSITVDVTQDSATVTYASAVVATHKGQVIKIDGDDQWYSIDDVTASTSFTLSSPFAGDTNATASATVAFPRITLPSELVHISTIAYTDRKPLERWSGGLPPGGRWNVEPQEPHIYYEVEPINTSDDMEIMLIASPNDRYAFELDGKKRITAYNGDSSKCGLPEKYEHVLISGVLWLILSQTKGMEEGAIWRAWHKELRTSMLSGNMPAMSGVTSALIREGHLPKSMYPDLATDNSV